MKTKIAITLLVLFAGFISYNVGTPVSELTEARVAVAQVENSNEAYAATRAAPGLIDLVKLVCGLGVISLLALVWWPKPKKDDEDEPIEPKKELLVDDISEMPNIEVVPEDPGPNAQVL